MSGARCLPPWESADVVVVAQNQSVDKVRVYEVQVEEYLYTADNYSVQKAQYTPRVFRVPEPLLQARVTDSSLDATTALG